MYRLLIVDSNTVNCELIKSILDWSAYNFSVIMTANTFEDAVDIALDLKPHVTLIDIHLGEHFGYDLADHMRSIGLDTSVCMLSTDNNPDIIRASMRCGAQDYLLKPLDPAELHHFLERVIINHLKGSLPQCCQIKNGTDPVLLLDYSVFSNLTNKILMLVKSSYSSQLTLVELANRLQMSSKYIGRIFLKDTGMKFSEYLMAYRMLEARKMILQTREKISVIAAMVGYVQPNIFYTHFRNYFHISPGSLRKYEFVEEPSHSPGHRRTS